MTQTSSAEGSSRLGWLPCLDSQCLYGVKQEYKIRDRPRQNVCLLIFLTSSMLKKICSVYKWHIKS